jgi:hypothetical protein
MVQVRFGAGKHSRMFDALKGELIGVEKIEEFLF